MKKLLLLIIVFLFYVFTLPAFASTEITLNGKNISFSKSPIQDNNRILVPFRSLAEALGCEVSYDADTRTIRVTKDGTFLRLTLNSEKAFINDRLTILDAPARTVNGTTMVPLRFVTEALGVNVGYENGKITLQTMDYAQVNFIDVGDGDAIYIKLPHNQDILIDAGNEKTVNNVLQCLRENRVDDIDLLISTHPHEGQMGGIPQILEKYKVKQIIDSGSAEGNTIYSNYSSAITKENAKYSMAERQRIKFNGAYLDILTSFKENWNRDIDGKSVVSLLTVGNVKFLFMSDLISPYDSQLNITGPVEIVKAASLGGANSTSQSFLDQIKPEVVVLSVSKDNVEFPHEITLQRIAASGTAIVRTSINGNIVVSTNGETYRVTISKDDSVQTRKKPVDPPQNSGMFVGHREGSKYHWPGCRRAKDIDIHDRVWFRDIQHAKDNGYQACEFCRPE